MTQAPVYIVDGSRTPFIKARGVPGPFSAADLAVYTGRDLLSRQNFPPTAIDEVILGCVMPREDEANIGRIVGLRLGCGEDKPGWTVQRNCASGMQSLDSAIKDISLGRHDLVLAGGTESMSRAPLILRPEFVRWLAQFNGSKHWYQKVGSLAQLRPHYFAPIIALLCGLTDPLYGLSMGQTAEILAYQFQISREEMDAFALRSHQRAVKAQEQKYFSEITTVYDHDGHYFEVDGGVRPDSDMEKLSKLKPFFDKKFGRVTAGNSSQVTDGAAMLLLASERAVEKHKLPVLARIMDTEWAALSPEVMGLGPVLASTRLLQRHKMQLNDVDFWEINEAFAAQVLGCVKAWQSDEFCQQHFGMSSAFGTLDQSKLNVDGGAVALGHPVGASGARIVLHLVHILKRENAKRGVASICIGGGQGGAMLIEV